MKWILAALSVAAVASASAPADLRARHDEPAIGENTLTISNTQPVTTGLIFDTAQAPSLVSTPSALTADQTGLPSATSLVTVTSTSGSAKVTATKTAVSGAASGTGSPQTTSSSSNNSTNNSTQPAPGEGGASSQVPASLSAALVAVAMVVMMV